MMNKKSYKSGGSDKPIITASEFGEWLYCSYRYNFEKNDNKTIQKSNTKSNKNVEPHKWLKKNE